MKFLLIAVWILSSLMIMLYFGTKDIRAFDPHGELQFASTHINFDLSIEETFKTAFNDLNKSAFHIQDQDCSCSILSDNHVRSLNIRFEKAGYSVRTLSSQSYAKIVALFPSLPALAIFDLNGNLAYLGPYSSGFYCGARTSLVEPIVASITSNTHMGALVISDSDGCYCDI